MPVVCTKCGLAHDPDSDIQGRVCGACGGPVVRIPTPKVKTNVPTGHGMFLGILLAVLGAVLTPSIDNIGPFVIGGMAGFAVVLFTSKEQVVEMKADWPGGK